MAVIEEYEQTYRIADLSELREHPANPRQGDVGAIANSIEVNGFYGALEVQKSTGFILAGNHRFKALRALGRKRVPIIEKDCSDREAMRILLVDNRSADLATYDQDQLLALLLQAAEEDNLEGTGYDGDDLDQMLADAANDTDAPVFGVLSARFLVPPFSVLDARQGYWQERKRKWINLGIHSELGRAANLLNLSDAMLAVQAGEGYSKKAKRKKAGSQRPGDDPNYVAKKREAEKQVGYELSDEEFLARHYAADAYVGGTSIFDPVLCEVAYRWFSPSEGAVLDPFAGGSVRGVVAATLGRRYTGIDLAGLQLQANAEQWRVIEPKLSERFGDHETTDHSPTVEPGELTPVQQLGEQWAKRDDLVEVGGVRGGKVRTCWRLAQGAEGLVTAGSRSSPQVNIVAHIAKQLGVPARVHTPTGQASGEVRAAIAAGAERVQHKAGYNNVINARARDDAAARGWREIPFGMECREAVEETAGQAENLPAEAQRIVIPVGSGMSLAGVLWGLKSQQLSTPVLGVVVGADPTSRLDEYAPEGWRDQVELVPSGTKYDTAAKTLVWNGIQLDAHYEAKCIPFMQAGDLLWIVGIRQTQLAAGPPPSSDRAAPLWIEGDSLEQLDAIPDASADLIFTCPPYAGLEVYSDDPRDISTMEYPEFRDTLSQIMRKALAKLRDDRFAIVVVGEVRDDAGIYRGLIPDVIRLMEQHGARLYNDAILVTAIGSLALRAARFFEGSRKLGKTHQNVLIFVKGNPARAHEACGIVEVPAESFEGTVVEVAIEPDVEVE